MEDVVLVAKMQLFMFPKVHWKLIKPPMVGKNLKIFKSSNIVVQNQQKPAYPFRIGRLFSLNHTNPLGIYYRVKLTRKR